MANDVIAELLALKLIIAAMLRHDPARVQIIGDLRRVQQAAEPQGSDLFRSNERLKAALDHIEALIPLLSEEDGSDPHGSIHADD